MPLVEMWGRSSKKRPIKNIQAGQPTRDIRMGTRCTECWEEWTLTVEPTCLCDPRNEQAWVEWHGTEKLPPLWGRKMVDPGGTVTPVALSNGATQRSMQANPYAAPTLARLYRDGWILYDECPVGRRRGFLDPHMKPCAGRFTEDECCPHVTAAIRDRKARYARKQAEFVASFKSTQERLAEANARTAEAQARTAEAQAHSRGFGGKRPK